MLEPDEYRVIAVKSWREATADVVAPGRKFLLFVAMDCREDERSSVYELAKELIHRGCRGVSAWGRNCNWIEDDFDWANVWVEMFEDQDIGLVMTSAHSDQKLEESLWFFLRSMPSVCDPDSDEPCAVVAVVEEREDWVERVRAALDDPAAFFERGLD